MIIANNQAVGASDLYEITNPTIPEIEFVLVDFNEATNTAHVAPSETYTIQNGLIYAVSISVGDDASASTKIVFDDADYIDDGTFVPYFNPVDKAFEFYAVGISGKLEHNCPVTAIVHSYIEGQVILDKLPQVVEGSVTEITAEDLTGCTKIKGYAFYHCDDLVIITVPASVTEVEASAFSMGTTTNKTTIRFLSQTPCQVASSSFSTTKIEKIIVPNGCSRAYKNATNWSRVAEVIFEESSNVKFSQTFLDSWANWGAERIGVEIDDHVFTNPNQITADTVYETTSIIFTDDGSGFYFSVDDPNHDDTQSWYVGTHALSENCGYVVMDVEK